MNTIRSLVARYPVQSFFGLSFLIAWGIWIPAGLSQAGLGSALTLLGAWAPTLSAVLLTTLLGGTAGLRAWLGRALRWRVNLIWYGVAMFSMGLIAAAAIGLHVLLGGAAPALTLPPDVPPDIWYVVLPIILLINVFFGGPIAEEFGWRGFAQPRLQEKLGALPASLLIGVVWSLWHLPFFLFAGGASVVGNLPFPAFVLLTTAWAVLFAWVYNNSGGSVVLTILYHAAVNTTLGTLGLLQPAGAGLRPLVFALLFSWAVIGVVTVVFGPARLTRRVPAGSPAN